jgi:multidrug efflux pump subunit AcrA (membrane-fusion protein)
LQQEVSVKKIVVILILTAAVAGCLYYLRQRNNPKEENTPQVTKAKVERGPILMDVASTGRVIANLDVDIKCKASGQVARLPFDVSDQVTSGDLLVELDPVDELRNLNRSQVALGASRARLAQSKQSFLVAQRTLDTDTKKAQAALESAERRATDAQAKAKRMIQLLEKKLASQEECDTAETAAIQAETDQTNARVKIEELEIQKLSLELKRQDMVLAESDVRSDEIATSISQQRLKETKVFAPINGVVAVRNVQIGQIIASGVSNVGGGTTLLTLSDLEHIFILASVDESDIGKVAADQRAIITADAFPNITFQGKVVRIATRGVTVSNVVTFEVKIEVLSENKSILKPEMTGNVQIIAADKKDALLIPAEAISRRRGQTTVLVVNDDGTTTPRPVEIGINDGFRAEVASGLTEGETVLVRRGEAESRWRGGKGGMSAGRMMMMGGGMKGGPRR